MRKYDYIMCVIMIMGRSNNLVCFLLFCLAVNSRTLQTSKSGTLTELKNMSGFSVMSWYSLFHAPKREKYSGGE